MAAVRGLEFNGPGDGIAQVDLAFDQVVPGRRGRILEIGHEHIRAGIERVDDHLAVDRPGDFHAAIAQRLRDFSDTPIRFADRARLGEEIGQCTGVETRLALRTCSKQGKAFRVEAAMQFGKQGQRGRRQNGVEAVAWRAVERDRVATGLNFKVFGCC